MLSGLHAPNAPFTQDDFCGVRVAGVGAVKLMWYHTEADVKRLRAAGVTYLLMRLPDSVDDTGRWKGDTEYADECVTLIRKFHPLGIHDYQLDNEPNLTWGPHSAGVWAWFMDRVVRLIRNKIPNFIRLGLAPLSWKPSTWKNVEDVWVPEQRKLVGGYQFLCVHSYWQSAAHYNLPPFGGNATHFHHLFGGALPIVITEWANSIHETGIPSEAVEAIRAVQYPQWLGWIATKPYVESAFLYIMGGTEDWRGFWPTDKVLRAMAA